MSMSRLFSETIAMYRKHGWQLKRVLLRKETRAEVSGEATELFNDASQMDAEINALWFARASHGTREAWELRLIGEPPYALFETFEQDEAEEDREDVRREMEARLRDYAAGRAQSS